MRVDWPMKVIKYPDGLKIRRFMFMVWPTSYWSVDSDGTYLFINLGRLQISVRIGREEEAQ